MVLSAAMMLRIGLNEPKGAEALENSVTKVLNAGFRTSDLWDDSCVQLGCKEIGEELLKAL